MKDACPWVFAGPVTLRMDSPDTIPVPVAPSFLPSRQFGTSATFLAGDRIVVGPSSGGTPSGTITSVPGYVGLRQTRVLEVTGSGFVNLASFNGLQCPPVNLVVRYNAKMVSLTGLEGIAPSRFQLGSLVIENNALLAPARAFAPLVPLLGCKGSGVNSTASQQFQSASVKLVGCQTVITNADALCKFATSLPDTTCPL